MIEESAAVEQGQLFINEAAVQKELKKAYIKVFMGSREGKMVLTDILQSTGLLRDSYVPNNPEQTIVNNAIRKVGLAIVDMLDKRGFEGILELEKQGLRLTQFGEEQDG